MRPRSSRYEIEQWFVRDSYGQEWDDAPAQPALTLDQQRIAALTKPVSLGEIPRELSVEGDPFGLLEVSDTYAKVLGKGYEQAVNLAASVVATADRATKKRWAGGETVTLPETTLSNLGFVMDVQHNSEKSSGFVRVRRTDETHILDRGFSIVRTGDGPLVLRDFRRGDIDPQDKQSYADLVEKAVRWIQDYEFQLRTPNRQPTSSHPLEVKAALRAAHKGFTNIMSRQGRRNRQRRLVTASITTLLIGGLTGNIVVDREDSSLPPNPIERPQLQLSGGITLNHGDSGVVPIKPFSRAEFFASNLLPTDHTIPAESLGDITKVVDWEDPEPVGLAPSECLDVKAETKPGSTVTLVSQSSNARDKLRATFTSNAVTICNISQEGLIAGPEAITLQFHGPESSNDKPN